jgi:hypothetical protein
MSRHDIWHLGVDQQYPGVILLVVKMTTTPWPM